jgi:hypothetical protein
MYLSFIYLFFIIKMIIITFFINIYNTYDLLKDELMHEDKIFYFKQYTKYISENNFINFLKYLFLSIENEKIDKKCIELDEETINEIKINELINEITEKHIDDTTNLQYFLQMKNIQNETIKVKEDINFIKNHTVQENTGKIDDETEIMLSDIIFETKKKIIKVGKKKINC